MDEGVYCMIASPEQLYNISQTIYCLMTDIYDRRYFLSPYNKLVPNELDPEAGHAAAAFHSIYDELGIIMDYWFWITGSRQGFDDIQEMILDKIDHTLEALCTGAVTLGYLDAYHISGICIIDSAYKEFFLKKMQSSGSILNQGFQELQAALKTLDIMSISFGDTEGKSTRHIERLLDLINQEFAILTDIAFLHGKAIGNGDYPFWLHEENPENNLKICSHLYPYGIYKKQTSRRPEDRRLSGNRLLPFYSHTARHRDW